MQRDPKYEQLTVKERLQLWEEGLCPPKVTDQQLDMTNPDRPCVVFGLTPDPRPLQA